MSLGEAAPAGAVPSPSEGVLPVIVVGAGPTGMTAATLLADNGVPVLVLDRWSGVFSQPRAVHLDDEVYRIIEMLGLAEEFAAISRPTLGLRLMDRDHRVLMEFDRSGLSPASGHPRTNMFDQPDLERLLRANAGRRDLVAFRGNVEVTTVEDDDSHIEVRGTDRATGAVVSWRARYVLGCDGANSAVRAAIGSEYEDLGFEQRWLVVDVETKADLRQWDGVHQICDARRAGTYMRVGDARYRWEFQLLDGEHAEDYSTIETLLPLLRPWIGAEPEAHLELLRVADYTFRAAIADHWRRGHLFLLGDAAHLTPPFIGQGMGAGLRDAANLAWKLAGVLDGTFPESILETYENERQPHARAMIQLARRTGLVMTGGRQWGDALRRNVMPYLARVPGLSARLVGSSTPALRQSATRPRRSGDRLAGRLAPNASVEGSNLDRVAGGSWVLVSCDPVAPSERDRLERHGCLVVHARGGALAAWLRRARRRAAVIRPDRAVQLSGARTSMVTASALAIFDHGLL